MGENENQWKEREKGPPGNGLVWRGKKVERPKRANVVGVDCACPDVGICKADLVLCNLCSAGLMCRFSFFHCLWLDITGCY